MTGVSTTTVTSSIHWKITSAKCNFRCLAITRVCNQAREMLLGKFISWYTKVWFPNSGVLLTRTLLISAQPSITCWFLPSFWSPQRRRRLFPPRLGSELHVGRGAQGREEKGQKAKGKRYRGKEQSPFSWWRSTPCGTLLSHHGPELYDMAVPGT